MTSSNAVAKQQEKSEKETENEKQIDQKQDNKETPNGPGGKGLSVVTDSAKKDQQQTKSDSTKTDDQPKRDGGLEQGPTNTDDGLEDIDKIIEIRYLEPKEAMFSTTAGGVLSLQIGKESYSKVDLYQAFPFTFENKFISVRNEKGDEIGIVADADEFDRKSKDAILHELQWRYYAPQILRILGLKDEFGHLYWDVETDRGYRKFVTRGREDGIQPITENRLLVVDMTGNRFEIPNINALDTKSLRYLESLV